MLRTQKDIPEGLAFQALGVPRRRTAGRPRDPNSIAGLCRHHGIDRRAFFRVREELRDAGIDHTRQDVIDIVKARKKTGMKT